MVLVSKFTYFLFLFQILLNFIGSPLVQANFLLITVFVVLSLFLVERAKFLWILLTFILFEGQGRVVWGYHPLFRVIFDLICFLYILKYLAKNKRIIPKNKINNISLLFILLHFFWWLIELLNPSGAGLFPSFATIKYYIFPLFLFFIFLNESVKTNNREYQEQILKYFVICILIFILCIYQNNVGIESVSNISDNYFTLFKKYGEFTTRDRFRPWGLSHAPGGMSVFMVLVLPFYFIFKPNLLTASRFKKLWFHFLNYLFIGLGFFSTFISQVRSTFIKCILIFTIASFIIFLANRSKFRSALITFLAIILLVVTFKDSEVIEEQSISAINRFEALAEEGVLKQRGGFGETINTVISHIELPFGFGPGMTTGYLPAYEARRKERFDIPSYAFWSLDNAYAFVFLELGLGALFYLGFLFSLFFSLLSQIAKKFIRFKKNEHYQLAMVVSVFFLVVIIGNWGAVSFFFNPESFFLWYWIALAFNALGYLSSDSEQG